MPDVRDAEDALTDPEDFESLEKVFRSIAEPVVALADTGDALTLVPPTDFYRVAHLGGRLVGCEPDAEFQLSLLCLLRRCEEGTVNADLTIAHIVAYSQY